MDSDAPIRRRSQDRLGRHLLAEHVAKSLLHWKGDESLVVGLHGPWGSGKSSVKNLTLEWLRTRKEPSVIVDFNPWEISGQHALTEEFFAHISGALGNYKDDPAAKQCAERLTTYGRTLERIGTYAGFFLKTAKHVVSLAAPLVPPQHTAIAVATATVLEAGEQGVEALKQSAEVVREGSELANAAESEDDVPLPKQKSDLRDQMAKLTRPIIVVVDDLDRLGADEICLLFRLIKSNCDFPRFVFLLLFDRPYVAKALEGIAPGRGEEYLEKIVQVPLSVPPPRQEELAAMLHKEVLALLPKRARIEPLYSRERWNELIGGHVLGYIRHIRDIRRLINAYRLHLGIFTNRVSWEVNPIDLLALETLRLFEPALYEAMQSQRWLLIGEMKPGVIRRIRIDRAVTDDGLQAMIKEEFQLLLKTVPERRLRQTRAFLKQLFPRCHEFRSASPSLLPLSALPVGHPAMFDVYFHRAVSSGGVSQAKVEKALVVAHDSQAFLEILMQHLTDGRHLLLLDHLAARGDVLMRHTRSVLDAVMRFAEGPVSDQSDWWWNGQRHEISQLACSCLRAEKDTEKRWLLFLESIKNAPGIRLVMALAADELFPHNRYNISEDDHLVPDLHIDEFKSAVAERAEVLMTAALNAEHRDLLWLLFRWCDCAGIGKPVSWLRTQLEDPRQALRILWATSGESRMNGIVVRDYGWTSDNMMKLLSVEEWKAAGQKAKEAPQTPDMVEMLKIFDQFIAYVEKRSPTVPAEDEST